MPKYFMENNTEKPVSFICIGMYYSFARMDVTLGGTLFHLKNKNT